MNQLDKFIQRMKLIGIDIEVVGNVPWIYLTKINGKPVKEKKDSEYGFVIAYFPIRYGETIELVNIKETFNLIKKYR